MDSDVRGAPADIADIKALGCDVCRRQSASRRLRMEACAQRAVDDLRGALEETQDLLDEELRILMEELRRAEKVLEELQRHRSHTPFFKVVARGERGVGFFSIYDGCTQYVLGERSPEAAGGCFVHTCLEDAERSVESFPRSSRAWGAPRTVLVVRGEGGWRFQHGKVSFDAITPLGEVPCGGPEALRSSWRR